MHVSFGVDTVQPRLGGFSLPPVLSSDAAPGPGTRGGLDMGPVRSRHVQNGLVLARKGLHGVGGLRGGDVWSPAKQWDQLSVPEPTLPWGERWAFSPAVMF